MSAGSQGPGAARPPGLVARLFGAQVSTRSLGLLRILIVTTVLFRFISPWVSHRMDDFAGTLVLSWALFVSAFFACLGYKTRVACMVMALSFAGLHWGYGFWAAEPVTALSEPVLYFQVVMLIALTPCGRSLSIDRVLEVRRARREGRAPPGERMPAWVLELFVVQAAAVYLWAAHDMLDPAWLSGSHVELYVLDLYGTSDSFVAHPGLPSFAVGLAYVAVVSAAVIGLGLLIRPLRAKVAVFALALQCLVLAMYSLNWRDCCFNLMMVNSLVACMAPQRLHQVFSVAVKGVRREPQATAPLSAAAGGRPWLGCAAVTLALLYFNAGPLRSQLLDREPSPLAWDWRLAEPPHYRPFCELRFYDMSREGQAIERWSLLGHASPRDLPKKQQRIAKRGIHSATQEVCDALRDAGDPAPQVEMLARCAAGREWRVVFERNRQVCPRGGWR